MNPTRANRILELDGLRAFAVISVVIYHMSNFAGSLPKGPHWMQGVVNYLGISGVSVFFIISGFIITSLLVREKAAFGHVSLTAFYIRRFFRIVPPFATYLLALLVIGDLGLITISHRNLLWSALFLGDTGIFGSKIWFVAHTWSLSVEEQFYLIFPPLFCMVFSFRARAIFATLCFAYVLSFTSLKLAHELSINSDPNWIYVATLNKFRYIIVGVFLALYGGPALKFLANKPRMFPLLLAIIMTFLQLFPTPPSRILTLLITAFNAALEPCICGLFVMWFVQNPSRCKPLRWPVVQWMGACSYSIYLWQQLFTGSAFDYHGWNPARSLLLSSTAIVTCAALSHYLIERPSIRLGRLISERFRNVRSVSQDCVQKAIL